MTRYFVEPDIAVARTLDPRFYADEAAYGAVRERVFARSWQWIGALDDVSTPGSLAPRKLLPGLLDEPLLLARDTAGTLRCLSNVCTHRGNLLVKQACKADEIRCGYHSRRFDLTGRMTFMPEFAQACDFPSAADNLPQVPFAAWADHGFASLDPAVSFDAFFAAPMARVASASDARFMHDPSRDADYSIRAHWALYVENYLEGFHVPFVHGGLNDAIDYGSYAIELHRYSSVQIGRAKRGQPAFDRDVDAASGAAASPSVDDHRHVAAYYVWVFPNLMLNFYPWGLSLNLVVPEAIDRTRVLFRSYVSDPTKLDTGAGAMLDSVEREDEAIIEAVQHGVRSRLYRGGRYSPTREQGVHHFQRLLCEFVTE